MICFKMASYYVLNTLTSILIYIYEKSGATWISTKCRTLAVHILLATVKIDKDHFPFSKKSTVRHTTALTHR